MVWQSTSQLDPFGRLELTIQILQSWTKPYRFTEWSPISRSTWPTWPMNFPNDQKSSRLPPDHPTNRKLNCGDRKRPKSVIRWRKAVGQTDPTADPGRPNIGRLRQPWASGLLRRALP